MQVSWIDPDEIARLAAQIDGPLRREETPPWDLDALPDFSQLDTLEEPGVIDPARLADAIDAPVPEPLDQKGAAPPPEVEHIREKLRAIRSRALDAGLLPPEKLSAAPREAAVATEPARVPPFPLFRSAPAAGPPSSPAPVGIQPPPAAAPEPAKEASPSRPTFPLPELPPNGPLTGRLRVFMPWVKSIAPCEDILLVDDHGDLLWGSPARADLALSVVLTAGAGMRTGSGALTRSSVFIRSRMGEKDELSVLPCPTRHGMVTLAFVNATRLTNEVVAALREALTLCVEGSGLPPAPESAAQASRSPISPGPSRPRPPAR